MNDPMASLREKFTRRCVGDRARIASAFALWENEDRSARPELIQIVHGLSGAGGTFGFDRLSERAADAEARLLEHSSADVCRDAVEALLAELDAIGNGERSVG